MLRADDDDLHIWWVGVDSNECDDVSSSPVDSSDDDLPRIDDRRSICILAVPTGPAVEVERVVVSA